MTKEEVKKYIDDNFVFLAISDSYSLIDKIYDDFEQQLSDMQKRIVEIERMYHHSEDDNAHLTQKVNGLHLRVDKVLRWGRSMRDYAHKYHKQVKEIEQRIEELEAPKSCDGCVHFVNNGCETDEWCSRDDSAVDYYEPKDKQ